MNSLYLPATTYNPQARETQSVYRNTIIEDSPQELTMPATQYTPRRPDFDDLYDVSEDESEAEDLPIVISLSPVNTRNDKNVSTLDIPSPTAWPSIHKLQKPGEPQPFNPALLSPPMKVPQTKLTPLLTKRSSVHSSTSNAPSLDESFTSEEEAHSIPTTPDLGKREEDAGEWTLPMQLNPASLMTLGRLVEPSISRESQSFALQPMEMRERGMQLDRLTTEIEICMTPIDEGELSAISIPSPGGFFSSLDKESRGPWLQSEKYDEPLPTAMAENFYGVPSGLRRQSKPLPALPTPSIQATSDDDTADSILTDGPPTARQVPPHWNCGTPGLQALKSPDFTQELKDYSEKYEMQLRESSSVNLDRTVGWLQSQGSFPGDIAEEEEREPEVVQSDPHPESPDGDKDTLFFRGFQHLQQSKKPADAFVHRKTRTEKLRLDRKCLFSTHVNHLEGKYTTGSPQPITAIKVGAMELQSVEEEEREKAIIADAIREQDALEQLEPVAWNVEATKYLNGGTLLTSPTAKIFQQKKNARILDLGGQTSCDWSWQVALEYPEAYVHAVCTADFPIAENIATPTNHKQTVVPNLWTLPFPKDHFDCISARSIYSLLKLDKPTGRRSDEYDLCLRECMRVLRPGGYIEFALIDADLLNSGPRGSALSVEFGLSLKTHGYDAAPTKSFLPRLRKAGFGQIRRAWLVLPMSQHAGSAREGSTTADASHITGMVGSWAWERWMLKLHKEMGKDSDRLLEGVVPALEEGARSGASWRCLSGWAQKPY